MTKRKLTKHEDDIRRGLRPIDRYEPRARSIGGAWRMAKCIDGAYVDAEQHDEVVDNLRSVAEDNKRECEATRIENARLKAEVERLKMEQKLKAVPVEAKLFDRVAALKAEVERLTAFTTRTIIPNEELQAQVERLTNNCNYLDQKLDEELDKSAMLCGQVMRLTKAGDFMADLIAFNLRKEGEPCHPSVNRWDAAKEGKGQP
jgi:hypothetical protein